MSTIGRSSGQNYAVGNNRDVGKLDGARGNLNGSEVKQSGSAASRALSNIGRAVQQFFTTISDKFSNWKAERAEAKAERNVRAASAEAGRITEGLSKPRNEQGGIVVSDGMLKDVKSLMARSEKADAKNPEALATRVLGEAIAKLDNNAGIDPQNDISFMDMKELASALDDAATAEATAKTNTANDALSAFGSTISAETDARRVDAQYDKVVSDTSIASFTSALGQAIQNDGSRLTDMQNATSSVFI